MAEAWQKRLEKFISQFKPHVYKKKEIILNAEEKPKQIFYLIKGYVRMYSLSQAGKELTLNIFKPSTYFPMTSAIAGINNNYFFEAMTEAEIIKVPISLWLDFLKKEPMILLDLTKRILIGLDGFIIRVEYLLFGSAKVRVAATLLLAARRFGKKKENGEIEIELKLTHQEIANLSGLTRESTSLELKKLEKKGLIKAQNRCFRVLDIGKLKKESLIYFEEKPLPYTF